MPPSQQQERKPNKTNNKCKIVDTGFEDDNTEEEEYHYCSSKEFADDNQKPESDNNNISHPNNETTRHQFKFKNNENKKLKKNGMVNCKYFICCTPECPAKYCVNLTTSGVLITEYMKEAHNHDPPAKPHTRKEVKERAITQMSARAMPSTVHKQIVNNAPLPLSSADVPSLSQLKNWKHELSIKDLPAGIAPLITIFSYFS
jgi:hypothetical protein